MYIHNALSWEIILKDANDLEFIALSVSSGITNTVKHCVSVLYRPPSAPVSFFDNFYNTLLSLSPHQFSSFVLIGDFNVNFCNTDHPYFCKLNGILHMLSLSQVVGTPTHTGPSGDSSLIDLALISNAQKHSTKHCSIACQTFQYFNSIGALSNLLENFFCCTCSKVIQTQRCRTTDLYPYYL